MNDLRFACRRLLKNPGFTAVAVLTLALGIGANTAIFSLVNSVLLRTVRGVRNPEQLLAFDFLPNAKPNPLPVFSYPDFVDFQKSPGVFDGMAASSMATVTIGTDEQAERTQALLVTPNWFSFLGVRVVAGRTFAIGEQVDRGPVAVIGEGIWRRRFDADPAIIGRTIRLNDHPFTVIGVVSPFHVDIAFLTPEIWVPLTLYAQFQPRFGRSALGYEGETNLLTDRRQSWLTWIARLKPGVSLEQARAAVVVHSRQLGDAYGPGLTSMGQYPLTVMPHSDYSRRQMSRAAPVGLFLLILAGLVLLIACANLANLLLARTAARRQEFAVRLALGADRARLIRQLLTEGFLLALFGGAAGMLLSSWTGRGLGRVVGEIGARAAFPIRPEFAFDANVMIYTLVLSLVSALAFALAPAIHASRPNLVLALKGEAGAGRAVVPGLKWRSLLVVGQVAVCFLLLIVAGLFVRGLQKARSLDLGFRSDGLWVMPINPASQRIPEAEAPALYQQIAERLAKIPRIRQVTFARFCQGDEDSLVQYNCQARSATTTNYFCWGNIVGGNYFQTLGTPIVRGRDFSIADLTGPPVAIVNETMAERLWPGANALGQQVKLAEVSPAGLAPVWAEVVGVAQDGQYVSLFQNGRGAFVYCPWSARSPGSMRLFIRLDGDPHAVLPVVRNALHSVDKRLPIYDLKPLAGKIAVWRLGPELGAILAGTIGAVGLLLAALGLYGLLAYLVGQRTREFGIRMALGARSGDVTRLVVRQGLTLVIVGSAFGLAGAVGGTRLIRHLLFGVSPLDLTAFVGVSVLLLSVAMLACYLPARRATRIDPMEALRYE